MTDLVHRCDVVSSEPLGAYRVLTLRAPALAGAIRPGQFLNVAVPECGGLLRRPFSVYLADPDERTVSIAFDAIGPGTRWLTTRERGHSLDAVGPLGHGFDLPSRPGMSVVVGGGYGAAAMSSVARALAGAGGEVHGVLGGRTAARVFTDDVLFRACSSVAVLTDDGSAGEQGLVTDALPALLRRAPETVYACGPMPMLEAVARLCADHGVPTQLAVEEFMACGVGVCWTCVVPVREGGSIRHARSCTDGPVLAGEAIAWA